MKTYVTYILLMFSTLISAQNIDWNDFNERKMDTAIFNEMNAYVRTERSGDSIVWSPVVQSEIMTTNYDLIKSHPKLELHSLHNTRWASVEGLPEDLKNKIIEENVNPNFLRSQEIEYNSGGKTFRSYGTFDYCEILVSIPKSYFITYQEIAKHAINSWNKSEGHAGIMNANYKNKVIVGAITFYHKETQRVFISFVYVS
jgi:hypothetical protein